MAKIILASQSPRRTEILSSLGIKHTIRVADIDETPMDGELPGDLVMRLAEGKAVKVAESLSEGFVIGSDTIVVFDGQILGKPLDDADAFKMLRSMSGHHHNVMTGVCIVDAGSGEVKTDIGITRVLMKPMTDGTIKAYIATSEPFGKAGAYGIQGIGSSIVESIEGEFYTVMGLSVNALLRVFEHYGLGLFGDLRSKDVKR